jgi:hypothetical protein
MGFEIPKPKNLEKQVFNADNEKEFSRIALEIYNYQFLNNHLYKAYCEALNRTPGSVNKLEDIPFLPIQFFKSFEIVSGSFTPAITFKSSGTTGKYTSRHLVKSLNLYEKSFFTAFERFYGKPETFCVLGLLPSYLERGDSSLVYMVDHLMKKSGHPSNGFYLYDHEKLVQTLLQMEEQGQKTILFGVSYALLDFAEQFPVPLNCTTIIETGGMKGRKKELSKIELYSVLKNAFSLHQIHSEYGMTELLSQAYAIDGLYKTPPWMKVMLREETDPFSFSQHTGVINVIDLANLHSCSFIATDDLGKLHTEGKFEVLGRLDHSDTRGCSQLIL